MVFTAPPVKVLPVGPVATVSTQKGQLLAVALPHRAGKSWRIARSFNAKVVREVSEADVGSNVVIVFRAVGTGRTRLVFALTRGESTTATASSTQIVTVRR
jgi:hypothetical protein